MGCFCFMADSCHVTGISITGYYEKEQTIIHDNRITIPIILDMNVEEFK
jgi:hypothetical protein